MRLTLLLSLMLCSAELAAGPFSPSHPAFARISQAVTNTVRWQQQSPGPRLSPDMFKDREQKEENSPASRDETDDGKPIEAPSAPDLQPYLANLKPMRAPARD